MQKKLIALAVAGMVAAPVAMAQSNVTIYGLVDMGYVYEKAGNRKVNKIDNGITAGSRIGLRGSEDLGNGLKALFTLEYGINPDIDSGISSSRQTFVGLQGGFGFVGLGRQYAPGFFTGAYDAQSSALFSPHTILTRANTSATNTINATARGRINNSINYKSPNFNGFAINAIYGMSERETTDRRRGDVFGLGATYANGPVSAGLIYHHINREGLVGSDQKEWLLGGAYDFGAVKLMGSYQRAKISDTDKIWQIGAQIPVSDAGKVSVAYGQLKDGRDSDYDAKAWTLSYAHNMSKRTMAYAAYSYVRNEDWQTASMFVTGVSSAPAGKNARGLAIGIRHVF